MRKKRSPRAVEANRGRRPVLRGPGPRYPASWIENWARQRGLSIQRDAAQYVWQTLGNDLQAITNELEKTTISIKDRKNITYDDVKAVVGNFRDYTPFDLAARPGQERPGVGLPDPFPSHPGGGVACWSPRVPSVGTSGGSCR